MGWETVAVYDSRVFVEPEESGERVALLFGVRFKYGKQEECEPEGGG
jgi:hypothetical protein